LPHSRDAPLKLAAARYGQKFLNQPEALIHGDLHSGSVMVTESDTRVIDPEFAFYGPSASTWCLLRQSAAELVFAGRACERGR